MVLSSLLSNTWSCFIRTHPTCAYFCGRAVAAQAVPILRCDAEGISLSAQQVGEHMGGVCSGVHQRREGAAYPLSL